MPTDNQSAVLVPIDDAASWLPRDFESTHTWKFQLSDAEVAGLIFMAEMVHNKIEGNINALLQMNKSSFELGAFSSTLSQVYQELRGGLGVALIRGLPIDDLASIDLAIIYWAIGTHLGIAAPNNPEGDMFGHITDLGKSQSDANSRGYQTREAMDYHCDQCDIVGLLCVRTAMRGGVSKLASSVAMYNTLLTENPRYAQLLSKPLYWTKHGEHAADELPYYQSPVFNFLNGKLCTSFGPKHIIKGYNLACTPNITEEQLQALNRAEAIADEQHVEMELKPGDMQFVNNYVSLHTRSAYVDHEEPERKRLLWRLWLMNDNLRDRTNYSKQWSNGVALGNKHVQIRIEPDV